MLSLEHLFTTLHRQSLLSLSLMMAISLPVNACGPDFINRLLPDRNNTLLYMPEGNFVFEVGKLKEVDPKLPIWKESNAIGEQESRAETSPEEGIIAQMRASNSVEQADTLSHELSPAQRLYTLGAVAFKQKDPRAVDYFRQLLDLPKDEQEELGLDAQYSLGRVLMQDYPDAEGLVPVAIRPDKTQLTLALAAFEQVIESVKKGELDESLLSLSSLGQQARIHIWLGDLVTATHLYAQQAAQGDRSGVISLRYVIKTFMNQDNEAMLQQAMKDPLVQQLVTIQLFTNNWYWLGYKRENEKPEVTARMLALINSSLSPGFKGRDRLAALAYRSGEYDMAAALLNKSGDTALSWWLRAKMALRNGDEKAATAAYAKAAAGFPSTEFWGNTETWGASPDDPDYSEREPNNNLYPGCRIAAEQGILALNRGDYLQAMALFYRGKDVYRPDVMDIAERVLTLDELKTFVDKNVPAVAEPAAKTEDDQDYYGQFLTPDAELRNLLARRLMRAGRYDEAQTYFVSVEHRKWAGQFVDYLKVADNLKADKPARAQAYYQAALLLRKQGLALISYEMTPDYALYGANYSYVGDSYDFSASRGQYWQKEEMVLINSIAPSGKPVVFKTWISPSEAARAKSALPRRNNNFLHYRWKAVDLASKSADLLPPKSQVYAAVLCHATNWIINRDRKGGLKLYQRYMKSGVAFDWSSDFGYQCPEPEFAVKS